jgi:hypothetical protein
LLATNPPDPSNSTFVEIGNKGAVIANQRSTQRCFDRKKLPLERERACGKAGNYRLLAQELAIAPGASSIA